MTFSSNNKLSSIFNTKYLVLNSNLLERTLNTRAHVTY